MDGWVIPVSVPMSVRATRSRRGIFDFLSLEELGFCLEEWGGVEGKSIGRKFWFVSFHLEGWAGSRDNGVCF